MVAPLASLPPLLLLLPLTTALHARPTMTSCARACTIKMDAAERAAMRARRQREQAGRFEMGGPGGRMPYPDMGPGMMGGPRGMPPPGARPGGFDPMGPADAPDVGQGPGMPGVPPGMDPASLEQQPPQPPQTPEEASKRLESMGAHVRQPEGTATRADLSWGALAGAEEVRLQVEEALILPLKHPDTFAAVRRGTRALGASSDRAAALLFYGPPGTGKTTVARIAAAQAQLPLVYAPLEAMMSKWFGQAERQLGNLFDHCGRLGRCILFLDELDALASSRGHDNKDEASRRMLSVLLARLDGMGAQHDITLIAATNRRADLDAALLSRFDVRVHFMAPEAPGRAEIFGLYAQHLPAEQRARLGEAARGLSGRDILDVCRQAERRWVCTLLRDAGAAPPVSVPLPPLPEYEAALRRRLESGSDQPDGAQVDATRPEMAQPKHRRATAAHTATSSLWQDGVVVR